MKSIEVKEAFLSFIEVLDQKSEDWVNLIIKNLKNRGLNLSKLHGQAYDDAANTTGILNGVKAWILKK